MEKMAGRITTTMKCAAVKMDKEEYREQQIQMLKKETGFDEIVIGCFLSNYREKHVCPIATGGWCRDYVKCKCMEEGIMRKIREQQAHNQNVGKEEETPVKSISLIALLIFIVLCCITVIAGIIELLCYSALTGVIAWIGNKELAMRLVVYVVISPMAAGLVYYRIRKENDKE